MADLGVHGGDGAEDEAADGEQRGLEDARDLEDLGAEASWSAMSSSRPARRISSWRRPRHRWW